MTPAETPSSDVYGHEDAPEALEEHLGCTNSDCVGEKLPYKAGAVIRVDAQIG